MSDQNRFRNNVEKNILNNNNLSISAPCPTAQGKWSSLQFRVANGNPRIVVYTNDDDDKVNHGQIAVRMTPVVFQAFLELWREAIDAAPGWKAPLEIEGFDWSGGKRSERAELQHRIVVGKDTDGVISIMVLDMKYKNRPRIKFEVGAPRFIGRLTPDGAPEEKSAMSRFFSRTWIQMLTHIVNQLVTDTWKEPQKREPGRGGYSGNQNQQRGGGNSGGGGNNYNQNDSFEEENIPF